MSYSQSLSANSNKCVAAIAVTLSLIVSSSAFADAILNVDDHTIVTAINSKDTTPGLLERPTKQFRLQAGKHIISARYDRLFEFKRGDDHDFVRSASITMPIELEDNKTYHLTMMDQPQDYRSAKKYAKQPKLALKSANKVVAVKSETDARDKGVFGNLGGSLKGLFGSGDDEKQQKIIEAQQATNTASNKATGTSAIPSQPSKQPKTIKMKSQPAPVDVANIESSISTKTSSNRLDQFMQLWLQATPAEREKIRQWIAK